MPNLSVTLLSSIILGGVFSNTFLYERSSKEIRSCISILIYVHLGSETILLVYHLAIRKLHSFRSVAISSSNSSNLFRSFVTIRYHHLFFCLPLFVFVGSPDDMSQPSKSAFFYFLSNVAHTKLPLMYSILCNLFYLSPVTPAANINILISVICTLFICSWFFGQHSVQ